MKVIFVNWTKPYFYKSEAEGYNKLKLIELDSEKYDMVDYELEIQKSAIINAKSILGLPVKLYTDTNGYEFYKDKNMIDWFDEIDVKTLNEYNHNTLNAGKWWTSGKSIAIGNEKAPFLFLDNDFILQSDIPKWMYDYDLVHTQWEIQRGKFYVSHDMIEKWKVPINNFKEEMMMPNTSFLLINNDVVRKRYLEEHIKIVSKNYDTIPEWLWLLSDQGILGYISRELNLNVASVEKKAYVSFPEWNSYDSNKCGFMTPWVSVDGISSGDDKLKYYHIWQDKTEMKKSRSRREEILLKVSNITKPNLFLKKSVI